MKVRFPVELGADHSVHGIYRIALAVQVNECVRGGFEMATGDGLVAAHRGLGETVMRWTRRVSAGVDGLRPNGVRQSKDVSSIVSAAQTVKHDDHWEDSSRAGSRLVTYTEFWHLVNEG